MGVKGLDALVRQQEGAWGTPIDFARISTEYKEQHGKNITLVVDGGSFLHYALKQAGPASYIYGYNQQLLIDELDRLCTIFQTLGIRIVIFLDGMSEPGKEAELLQRENRKRKMIETLCDGGAVQDIFVNRTGEYETMSLSLTKYLYATFLNQRAAQSNGLLVVHQMEYEADLEVARFCSKEQHYAVLANDTDYFIFDVPAYIPMSSLEITNNNVTAVRYNKYDFSKSYSAQVEQLLHEYPHLIKRQLNHKLLPDLSCIIGNDFFSCKSIHDRMKQYLMDKFRQDSVNEGLVISLKFMSKQIIAAMFLMVHDSLQFSDECIDTTHETFAVNMFTIAMMSTKGYHRFIREFEEARQMYDLTRPVDQRAENSLADLCYKKLYLDRNGTFANEILSIIRRQFYQFGTVVEPRKSTVMLVLSPLRHMVYQLVFNRVLVERLMNKHGMEIPNKFDQPLESHVHFVMEIHSHDVDPEKHEPNADMMLVKFPVQCTADEAKHRLQLKDMLAMSGKKQNNQAVINTELKKRFSEILGELVNLEPIEDEMIKSTQDMKELFLKILKVPNGQEMSDQELMIHVTEIVFERYCMKYLKHLYGDEIVDKVERVIAFCQASQRVPHLKKKVLEKKVDAEWYRYLEEQLSKVDEKLDADAASTVHFVTTYVVCLLHTTYVNHALDVPLQVPLEVFMIDGHLVNCLERTCNKFNNSSNLFGELINHCGVL